MSRSLRELETPEDGPAADLLEAISRGDFAEAAEALEQVQEQLESGAMSEAERASMEQELESLSEQLEQLAADNSAVQEALRQAGLDPQLANDPQALQQAMEQADQLSEQQKQDLQELVEAEQLSEEQLKQLAEAAEQMCKECQGGSSGEAGQKLSQQLSKMEQLKQMLKQAEQTSGQCRSQCQSLGQQLSQTPGSAPGSRSLGQEQQIARTDTDTESTQASTSATGGPVVAEQQVDGMLRTGESVASFREVLSQSREGFEDAFNDDRLPRKYHDLIKRYFGDADEVTEAVEFDAEQVKEPATDGEGGADAPAPPEEDSGSGE